MVSSYKKSGVLLYIQPSMLTPVLAARNNIYLLEEAEKTRCVVLIGKMYLSLAICNEAMDTVYLIHHYQTGTKSITRSALQAILTQAEVVKASSVLVGMDSYKSVLIPYSLYQPEFKEDYFNFLEDRYPDEEINEHTIASSLVELYTIKNATRVALTGLLNEPKIISASAALLKHYPASLMTGKEHQFFIAVKDDLVIISLYQQATLQLHQQYPLSQEMDVVYHICNIVDLKSLPTDQIAIQIHGEHATVNRIHDLLKQHFDQVRYCNRIREIHYPDSLYTHPTHYFYNLFALFSCA